MGRTLYEPYSETFAVKGEVSRTETIAIPKQLSAGKYILRVKINYENSTAESYDSFEVVEEGLKMPQLQLPINIPKPTPLHGLLIMLLGIILLIVIILFSRREKKSGKKHSR